MQGFDELFGESYLHFWRHLLTDERSDREVEVIWRLLAPTEGTELLDLACGHGRIANRLAGRGLRVTGLDRSARFLEAARADAAARGVEVDYVEGDMRELPWHERFDAVLCWFTAFGYFEDGVLRDVLRGVRRTLRPGGRFLLEANSLTNVMTRLQPFGLSERGDDFLLERRRFDPLRGGFETEYVAIRDGDVRRYPVFIRGFTFTELRDWLLDAGFSRVEGFGEDAEPLTHEHRRALWLATA
ncbi:MAG TPA: methyltransferase domain-containing protein [Gaiellaceae bacterium]|nr:methyltransferase domain-containing protein [Gaiellaceae bacterium]